MSEKTAIEKKYSIFSGQDLPADLALVGVWLAASIVVIYLPLLNTTAIRIFLTLPIVFFIPGYSLIAALFPGNNDIDLIERMALSIGLSIAIVPMIGLGLNFSIWGIRLEPLVLSLTFFTAVMIVIGYYRRALLKSEERFRIPFLAILISISQKFFPQEGTRRDRILSSFLTLAALIAIVTTMVVITFPKEGEQFTEFFILGENRTATGYPDQIIVGQNYPMYIGVGNHEYRNTTYQIEIWMMHSEFDKGTNTSRIVSMDPYERLTLFLVHNETRIIPFNLSVRKGGYDRLEFLLFNETVPGLEVNGNDRINLSYRNLYLGVPVY